MKRVLTIAALLAVVALAGAGCYTVLRHPTDVAAAPEMSYYRTCADCHADAAFYHPYYSYGRSHYRWNAYYGYPWWYEDYWWWDPYDGDHEGGGRDVETGSRHLWGTGGWASGGWGFASPPSGSGQAPPSLTPSEQEGTRPPIKTPAAKPQPKRPPAKEDEKKRDKEEKKQAQPVEPKKDDDPPRWRPADSQG